MNLINPGLQEANKNKSKKFENNQQNSEQQTNNFKQTRINMLWYYWLRGMNGVTTQVVNHKLKTRKFSLVLAWRVMAWQNKTIIKNMKLKVIMKWLVDQGINTCQATSQLVFLIPDFWDFFSSSTLSLPFSSTFIQTHEAWQRSPLGKQHLWFQLLFL